MIYRLVIKIESVVKFAVHPMVALSKIEEFIEEYHLQYPTSTHIDVECSVPVVEVGVKPEDMTPNQQALYLLIRELTAYIGPYETKPSIPPEGAEALPPQQTASGAGLVDELLTTTRVITLPHHNHLIFTGIT